VRVSFQRTLFRTGSPERRRARRRTRVGRQPPNLVARL